MIGSFYQPKFVWEDIAVFATLPFREIVCGMGEVVKYRIIRDKDFSPSWRITSKPYSGARMRNCSLHSRNASPLRLML